MQRTSSPLGWHITLRLEDGRNLVRDVRERRLLARTVLRLGESSGLFLFSVPDTHLHLAITARREEASPFAHAVECALRHGLRLPVPFEAARFRPIVDQSHLHNTVGYILGNARRHGNESDPRCEGTDLPDLLGLRVTGRMKAQRLAALLPRLRREELLAHLPVDELQPGRDARLLADASAASIALSVLCVRGEPQRSAASAAAHVARNLGLSISATSRHLGSSTRTVSRFRLGQPRPDLVRAIELQLGLMEQTHPARPPLQSSVREHGLYQAREVSRPRAG